MKAPDRLALVMALLLFVTPSLTVAQTRGPLPIREAEAGLLQQASIPPANARLVAFGSFPGAHMVAGEIRRDDDRLVYSFDLKFPDHHGIEHVQIDAHTGQVLCLDYTVELDHRGNFIVTGPENLVSLVMASFAIARATAESAAESGHVVGWRLRVSQSGEVYVFDIDVGEGHSIEHVSIDAITGEVISGPAS
jgi:uncharacterized membrane protein YkoI